MEGFKSGFITIIGRPNVGKSTFLNKVVGSKVAIMSDKPQTTRNKIQGIVNRPNAQLIFIDTPGIHKPKHELGDFMTKLAFHSISGADMILFMVNAGEHLGKGEELIIGHLLQIDIPIMLVINKIDLVEQKSMLLQKIEEYKDKLDFVSIHLISSLNGDGVSELMDDIIEHMQVGHQYYPTDLVTDHPEQFLISEIIREKILNYTRDEIPHSIAVVIEQINQIENREDFLEVHANIIVERKSQKGIIIGKNGKMLKKIGTDARKEIKGILGTKVLLQLWVSVEKDWRNRQKYLNEFGYRMDQY